MSEPPSTGTRPRGCQSRGGGQTCRGGAEGGRLEAQEIVAIWNARQAGGRALCSTRRIGAAIAAGLPWLTFYCPGSRVVGSVDLRTLDRPPGASISSLIPSLSCRRCSPHAPFAKLEALTTERARFV